MVLLLHFAFKSTSAALWFFRNSPSGSGYFLSFAIRMSQPFDAKKEKREHHPSFVSREAVNKQAEMRGQSLYWLLRTSVREREPFGFHRPPLSLSQVVLSHQSRREIVLLTRE